jgi:hypothetical protein
LVLPGVGGSELASYRSGQAEGAQKKRRTPPGIFPQYQIDLPTYRQFLVRFWAFLDKGSSIISQKSFSKIKCQFSSGFFIVFWGGSHWGAAA